MLQHFSTFRRQVLIITPSSVKFFSELKLVMVCIYLLSVWKSCLISKDIEFGSQIFRCQFRSVWFYKCLKLGKQGNQVIIKNMLPHFWKFRHQILLTIRLNRKCFSEWKYVQICIYLSYVFGEVMHFKTGMENRAPWKRKIRLVLKGFFSFQVLKCFKLFSWALPSPSQYWFQCRNLSYTDLWRTDGFLFQRFLFSSHFSVLVMVRLPDNGCFWKCGFQLFIVRPSLKKIIFILVPPPRGQYLVPTHLC